MDAKLERYLELCVDHNVCEAEYRQFEAQMGEGLLGVRQMADGIRRTMGVPIAFWDAKGAGQKAHWFVPTAQIRKSEMCIGMFGYNNPHVTSSLLLPEGRHVKLALMIREVKAALVDSGVMLPESLFEQTVLGNGTPRCPEERVGVNFFNIVLAALSRDFSLGGGVGAVALYRQAVEGLDGRTVARLGLEDYDADAVARDIDCALEGFAQNNVIVRALLLLEWFVRVRPFPVANGLIGRVAISEMLRRSGMALLAYVPVLEFLLNWRSGVVRGKGYRPPYGFWESVVEVGQTSDWTGFVEVMAAYLEADVEWLSSKLDRIVLRRTYVEELIARDLHFNVRQHEVLVEALVHDDAEFTFAKHMEAFQTAYSTAHADLSQLVAEGYLVERRVGRQHVFVASEDVSARMYAFLKALDPVWYAERFNDDGRMVEGPHLQKNRSQVALVDDFDPQINLPQLDPSRRIVLAKGLR